MYKLNQQELQELKREVKQVVGYPMCSIHIEAYGEDFIEYSYFKIQ